MTQLLELPSECLLEIGQFLSIPEISHLRRTCRTMSDLFAADKYWHCAEFERFIDVRNVHKTKLETYRDAYACLQLDKYSATKNQILRSRYPVSCISGAYTYFGLQGIRLTKCALSELPVELGFAFALRSIEISHSPLSSIACNLHNLPDLSKLVLKNCHFHEVPSCIYKCASLRHLSFRNNMIKEVDPKIVRMSTLRHIDFGNNLLLDFPTTWPQCGAYTIIVKGNRLKSQSWTFATNPAKLDMSNTNCKKLAFTYAVPYILRNGNNRIDQFDVPASNMHVLHMKSNGLAHLPNMDNLTNLQELNMRNNSMEHIDDRLYLCTNLRVLNFAGNRLKNVLFLDYTQNLTHLDLSDNFISDLPNLSRLPLVKLGIRGCGLVTFPTYIPLTLQELDISGNFLTAIPRCITVFRQLEKLIAKHNRIVKVTKRLYLCNLLQYIDLSWNQIIVFPMHWVVKHWIETVILSHNLIEYVCRDLWETDCTLQHVEIQHLDVSFNPLKYLFLDPDDEFGRLYLNQQLGEGTVCLNQHLCERKEFVFCYPYNRQCSLKEYLEDVQEGEDIYGMDVEVEQTEDNYGKIIQLYHLRDRDGILYGTEW